MRKDLVSIIIPYYKNKKFILQCVNSAAKQSYKKKEIIIIYDDDSLEDLKSIKKNFFKKKNLKIVVNKKNLGAGASRNIGIKKSRGEFLAFLDSDDVWLKNKLKIQIKFMKNNKLDLSYTSYNIIDKQSKKIGFRKCRRTHDYNKLLTDCYIGLSTVIIKKSFKTKNLIKFPKIKTKEDYILWLQLAKHKLKFRGIEQALTKWRKTDDSLSSNSAQKLFDGFRVYYSYMRFNFLKSIYYLFLLSVNFLKKNYLE